MSVESEIETELHQIACINEHIEHETRMKRMSLARLQKEIDAIEAPFREQIEKSENKIKELTLKEARSFKSDYGKVTFTKGHVRTSWDTDKLLGYAVAYPAVLNFKKESVVEPRVSIKINQE